MTDEVADLVAERFVEDEREAWGIISMRWICKKWKGKKLQ